MGGAECFSKSTRVAGDHGKAEEARGARQGGSGLWRGEVDFKTRQGKNVERNLGKGKTVERGLAL